MIIWPVVAVAVLNKVRWDVVRVVTTETLGDRLGNLFGVVLISAVALCTLLAAALGLVDFVCCLHGPCAG